MTVMLTCDLMWLGCRVAAQAISLVFQKGQIPCTLTISYTVLALLAFILDLSVTSTTILPFGACYVIVHRVY